MPLRESLHYSKSIPFTKLIVSRLLYLSYNLPSMRSHLRPLFAVSLYLPHLKLRALHSSCYNSFFSYVACPLTRFYSFAPFLRNAISLNTASYLYAVHGSFILFLLSFYGRPSLYMCCLSAASFQLSHYPVIPFISI